MRKSRYSGEQIIQALKLHEAGRPTAEIYRKLGVCEQTFYRWKAKYGGMDVADAKRLKDHASEHACPNRSFALWPDGPCFHRTPNRGANKAGLGLSEFLASRSGSIRENSMVRYDEPLFRPPSEADSFILQATLGCSWNACTYCAMYRGKHYQMRSAGEILADIAEASARFAEDVRHVFVADGDPLGMGIEQWEPILLTLASSFPRLRRVSTYATARNLLEKSPDELKRLRELGLSLLYIGPESGDDVTLRRIAKGANAAEHVEAARKAKEAGMEQSLIFLLGAGGRERSEEHARASGRLATAMDPRFLSTLTLTVIPGTPISRLEDQGRFELPDIHELLTELRWFIEEAHPSAAIFRSNHASNYLPIGGRLPRDHETILAAIDEALAGRIPLRPEWARGL